VVGELRWATAGWGKGSHFWRRYLASMIGLVSAVHASGPFRSSRRCIASKRALHLFMFVCLFCFMFRFSFCRLQHGRPRATAFRKIMFSPFAQF